MEQIEISGLDRRRESELHPGAPRRIVPGFHHDNRGNLPVPQFGKKERHAGNVALLPQAGEEDPSIPPRPLIGPAAPAVSGGLIQPGPVAGTEKRQGVPQDLDVEIPHFETASRTLKSDQQRDRLRLEPDLRRKGEALPGGISGRHEGAEIGVPPSPLPHDQLNHALFFPQRGHRINPAELAGDLQQFPGIPGNLQIPPDVGAEPAGSIGQPRRRAPHGMTAPDKSLPPGKISGEPRSPRRQQEDGKQKRNFFHVHSFLQ